MTQLDSPVSLADQQHIVLSEMSWAFYESLLAEIGERPIRVTYHKGRIEIMPPLGVHEIWKKRIATMIELVAIELNIPFKCLGSTTFQRKERKAGLEPDECYYLANEAAVRGKERVGLAVDPPPDLAVEVDITRRSIAREPIYAALDVPEIWRFDGKRLAVLALTTDGTYEPVAISPSFPFLPMDVFREQLTAMRTTDDVSAYRAFQTWVRTVSKG